jgi:hypothetical protein
MPKVHVAELRKKGEHACINGERRQAREWGGRDLVGEDGVNLAYS